MKENIGSFFRGLPTHIIHVALKLCALLLGISAASAQDSFYNASPADLEGPPGSIIRMQRISNPPAGASDTYLVLFRSRGIEGEPIAASGFVVIPQRAAPTGGRAIVSWAHPTTGIARKCAPSLRRDIFTGLPGLKTLLDAGHIVAATDYRGLGTVGPHPYMIGLAQAHTVLDAARAARLVPGAEAGKRLVTWGYSQGGFASLQAGIQAAKYAPEFELAAIAAIAPPTDLGALFREDINEAAGKVLASFVLWAWSEAYGIPLAGFVQPEALAQMQFLTQDCMENKKQDLRLALLEQTFERHGFLKSDVTRIEPWRSRIAENIPGLTPSRVPVFIAQGLSDTIVHPPVTEAYRAELCKQGRSVTFLTMPGIGHSGAAKAAAKPGSEWIVQRLAGVPANNGCR